MFFISGEYNAAQKESQRRAAYWGPERAQLTKRMGEETSDKTVPVSSQDALLANILSKLPPMPIDWKPGDPIPGLPAPPAPKVLPEEAKPAAAARPQRPEEETAIHRQPVTAAAFEFALNPDLELVFEATDSDSESL